MRTALLVVDVQQGLFDREPRPAGADAVLGRIVGLVASAHDRGDSFERRERARSS